MPTMCPSSVVRVEILPQDVLVFGLAFLQMRLCELWIEQEKEHCVADYCHVFLHVHFVYEHTTSLFLLW